MLTNRCKDIYKTIINKRFGNLIIIKQVGSNKRTSLWECLCDCGNIKIISYERLCDGIKSCGCKNIDYIQKQVKNDNQITLEFLQKEYIELNKTQNQISKEYNISRSAIQLRIAKFNIKKEFNLIHKFNKEFFQKEYIQLKKSASKIAQENNLSISTIQKYLNKFGILKTNITSQKNYTTILTKEFLEREFITFNKTIQEIVNENNISRETITKYLIKFNLKEQYIRKPHWNYKDITYIYWDRLKQQANYKKRKFNISVQYVWELYEKQNKKCALTNWNINFPRTYKDTFTASLDRMDSSKGYEYNNVQLIHKNVNMMKSNYSIEYFIILCKLVTNPIEITNNISSNNNVNICSLYWGKLIHSAKLRNIDIDITKEELLNIYIKQNGCCAITNIPIFFPKNNSRLHKHKDSFTASVDRIDSSKPYNINNIHFVHKDINRIKHIHSLDYFTKICKAVAEKNK